MRQSESNANRYLAESIRGVRAVPKVKKPERFLSGHYVLAGLVFLAALMGVVRMMV